MLKRLTWTLKTRTRKTDVPQQLPPYGFLAVHNAVCWKCWMLKNFFFYNFVCAKINFISFRKKINFTLLLFYLHKRILFPLSIFLAYNTQKYPDRRTWTLTHAHVAILAVLWIKINKNEMYASKCGVLSGHTTTIIFDKKCQSQRVERDRWARITRDINCTLQVAI